jgi:Xaa-Pro aminopeptidase
MAHGDTAGAARRREVEAKVAAVQDALRSRRRDRAVLSLRRNFAWLTGGGDNHVVEGSEDGVAAAVVDDHERILAIRRGDNDQWEPPGGVLEQQESITEGLVRDAISCSVPMIRLTPQVETEIVDAMQRARVRAESALGFRTR